MSAPGTSVGNHFIDTACLFMSRFRSLEREYDLQEHVECAADLALSEGEQSQGSRTRRRLRGVLKQKKPKTLCSRAYTVCAYYTARLWQHYPGGDTPVLTEIATCRNNSFQWTTPIKESLNIRTHLKLSVRH